MHENITPLFPTALRAVEGGGLKKVLRIMI